MIRPAIFIWIAGLLVPHKRRAEWMREWLAELHYAEAHASEARSFAFARGAFHDAVWQQRDFWTRKQTQRLLQSPSFCLGSLAGVLLILALSSGLLRLTRMALEPAPYREGSQIVTIAQAATIATRTGVPEGDVALWRKSAQSIEALATYRWNPEGTVADVSANFFDVLGAGAGFRNCSEACVVLNYDFARSSGNPATVTVEGKPYGVTGIAPRGFWFLSPNVRMWRIVPPDPKARTGVVARLRADSTIDEAASELGLILRNAGESDWESIFELTAVQPRVRFVFWVFGFSVMLAVLIVLPILRLRMPKWNPAAAGFFLAKTCLALLAVLLVGIEFTGASSITMLGGADGYTAVSTWLFVMGSTGVLAWSIADQRQRCRVCLKRLGLAAHVGCTGCLLLDWAGTELVCVEGHGMLHVPEMAVCWQDPDRWTFLDETWQELFRA